MSKRNKQNIRKTASSKQTSGGGFVFEDKASAWFISHFLSNRPIFDSEIGYINKISYQVRSDGWLLDDFLISTNYKGIGRKIAVSCKSNAQISGAGPNKELLADLWNQYLNIEERVFCADTDYLCIINARLSIENSSNLNNLLRLVKECDPHDLHERINSDDRSISQSVKRIYHGFHCPLVIGNKQNITTIDTIMLLSRILFIEFDFENDHSKDESNIVEICKGCLVSSSHIEAESLFKALCALRSEQGPLSGFLDYDKVILKLKDYFNLKGFPDHYDDWGKIIRQSKSKMDLIPDKIGNKISFATEKEIQEIDELFADINNIFILGKSGYGKSVLAKKYILEKLKENDKLIWIDSEVVQNKSIEDFFGLKHNIVDIVNNIQSKGYLIIDGVDRFFKDTEFDLIVPILSSIKTSGKWKIFFTCQMEDYESVLDKIRRKNLVITGADLKLNIDVQKYIPELIKSFPEISDLFRHQHLIPILSNLKYLDLLAHNVSGNSNLTGLEFIGESTIIDWIWKYEIEPNGTKGSRFIQDFSEKQAQRLTSGVPISDFGVAEVEPVDDFKKSKILYESQDRLYLIHDLFGDWARYKLIRANKDQIKPFLLSKDIISPLWCKAIRLYGIFLLEGNNNSSKWVNLFTLMDSAEPKEKIIQDLLLESVIFSANPYKYLDSLWDFFGENDGDVLHRFLDRFLLKATVPNKTIMNYVQENGKFSIAEASSYYRTPNHQYWFDVLEFIISKKNDFITLAKEKTIKIVKLWLEYTANKVQYRKECSEIALEVANWMFEFKHNGGYVGRHVDQEIYKAFLLAVDDYPDEVIELALKLCKRIRVEREIKSKSSLQEEKNTRKSFFEYEIVRDKQHWPDGPYESVDDAFEKVCKYDSAFFPMIVKYPHVASEILLALFIDEPKNLRFGYESNYNLDINTSGRWFPPFYDRGPFLEFLKYRPEAGLSFIIKLINFATVQWSNKFNKEEVEIPKIKLDIEGEIKEFIGDHNVYYWFRNNTSAPDTIVSALMALEKFLYDSSDNDTNVEKYAELILKEGNSIALLSILITTGKYNPPLFSTVLQPLLEVYDFYRWENSYGGALNSSGMQMMGSFDHDTFEKAKEWNNMVHRKYSLLDVSVFLFLNNHIVRKEFENIKLQWKALLQEFYSKGYWEVFLERLISFFNIDNYILVESPQGDYYNYIEPEEEVQRYKEIREESDNSNADRVFPFVCFQELEKSDEYSTEECMELWHKVQQYALIDDETPYSFSSGKHQMVLGGCALLLRHKKVWEENYPQVMQWIIDYTQETINNYKFDYNHISHNYGGYSWSDFAAIIISMLWLSETSEAKIRLMTATLLLNSPYEAISAFIKEFEKNFKWSDPKFVQVQNLLISWSAVLYKDAKISKQNFLSQTKSKSNLKAEKNNLINDFKNNKMNTTLIEWSNLRIIELKSKNRYWDNDYDVSNGHNPGIDTQMLWHIFLKLPDINECKGRERDHLLKIWKQLFDQVIYELGEVPEDLKQFDNYPSQFHLWVIESIAIIILKTNEKDEVQAEYFSDGIMQYGFLAADLVEHFCSSFFVHHLAHSDLHSSFLKQWEVMLDFATKSPAWKLKRHYRKDNLWETLMGVSALVLSYWNDDKYFSFFKKIAARDIKIMQKKALNPHIIFRLTQILKTKPGLTVLNEGLEIINKYINFCNEEEKTELPEGLIRVPFEYKNELAQMASHLWEKNKPTIINNPEALNNFKKIVLYLVAKQNPIGLELQNRIIE
ncbi:hypothetical protein [Chryseobacterium bernardetii]|nr:hypothetical protein [Chryseobacterium bernardetii]